MIVTVVAVFEVQATGLVLGHCASSASVAAARQVVHSVAPASAKWSASQAVGGVLKAHA